MDTSRIEGVSTRRDTEIAQSRLLNFERLRKVRQVDALEQCGVEVEFLPRSSGDQGGGAVSPLDLNRVAFSRLYGFDDRHGLF